jgi:hypothetical protein
MWDFNPKPKTQIPGLGHFNGDLQANKQARKTGNSREITDDRTQEDFSVR